MQSFVTALNSLDLQEMEDNIVDALKQHSTNIEAFNAKEAETQPKRKYKGFNKQVHQALMNHKEGIEKMNKVSQHLQSRMSDVADILREHSDNYKNLQHRIHMLEELVLQLSKNTSKNQEAFCATNQPLANGA